MDESVLGLQVGQVWRPRKRKAAKTRLRLRILGCDMNQVRYRLLDDHDQEIGKELTTDRATFEERWELIGAS